MSRQSKPSIVFVHGIWADGSCFGKVIPTLQAEGYEVAAAQHSLDTVTGDVATVSRTLGRVSAPAILVGHSYGPDWSISLHSPRTTARRRRASRTNSPSPMSSPTSRSPTGGSGCSQRASRASRAT